jgi:Kef-type K+ transport system membrane component KefB
MILFLQIAVILAASRSCGWLVTRWLRQPQVIGEMIAGVVLGPSLLGRMSKSNIPVGRYSEQHAFGMSTMPEMRPSIGADPSRR